jgi:group I intron endonuclease
MLTSPSGKKYIGQTWNLQRRMWDHRSAKSKCSAICSAIKKYGKGSFVCEVLHEGIQTQEELSSLEIKEIKDIGTLYPNGYNLTTGGEGASHNKASREKMSSRWAVDRERRINSMKKSAAVKKNCNENLRRFLTDSVTQQKRIASLKKTLSKKDVKEKRSLQRKKEWTDPEIRKKRIEAMKAAQSTDSYKKSASDSLKKRWECPKYREKMLKLNLGRKMPLSAIESARIKRMVPVICLETRDVFKSVSDAAIAIGVSRSCISCAVTGKQKTAGGYHWAYA